MVSDFAADRSFTTTLSRYDAKTLALRSASQHASCCGDDWTSNLTRNGDGSYTAASSHRAFTPRQNEGRAAIKREWLNPRNAIIVVNALGLVPWIYHVTHPRSLESVTLPSLFNDKTTSEMLDVIQPVYVPTPAGVPNSDLALRLVNKFGGTTTLWYNPCTFVLDAIQTRASLVLRENL